MVKLDANRIFENIISIAAVGALAYGAFWIAQNKLSFFSYQGMSRDQVITVMDTISNRFPLLSRACGKSMIGDGNFCRGIYLTNSGMLYYRMEDSPTGETSFELYQVPTEKWTTSQSLIPDIGGNLVSLGEDQDNRFIPNSQSTRDNTRAKFGGQPVQQGRFKQTTKDINTRHQNRFLENQLQETFAGSTLSNDHNSARRSGSVFNSMRSPIRLM